MLPKILIISRNTWEDENGTSSTLSNLFADYSPDCIAHIYIETKQPKTNCCYQFFQISEISLVHKFYKWRTQTGHTIDTRSQMAPLQNRQSANQEEAAMNYVRGHRSIIFTMMREVLWSFNGWKSKELRKFILDFDPDVVWLDGSPLPLMNRLYNYALKISKKPATIFMQDDVYTYKSCRHTPLHLIHKWYLRQTIRRVVKKCNNMFVISPKMKKEYDEIFGVSSTIITKGINVPQSELIAIAHKPIKLVYLGQIIYGRILSLIAIANALKKINNEEKRAQLYIYTNNKISEIQKEQLLDGGNVFIMPPVPFPEVTKVINENDVVVFVESFNPMYSRVARLSFSTKICDYLGSGKSILAIGSSDIASIEYFKDEDAALVATSVAEITNQIEKLSNQKIIEKYSIKALNCAKKNHSKEKMNKIIYEKLIELSNLNCKNDI